MTDVVQIRAQLIEHQHDALISFYDTYPRLFVNKLLLRLCEWCLTQYPPTLAHFVSTPEMQGATKRQVVIRLDKDIYPGFWKFYKELPYGARSVVLPNVMNQYATMAEADKRLLERVYWGAGTDDAPGSKQDKATAERAQPLVEGAGESDSSDLRRGKELVEANPDRAPVGTTGKLQQPASAAAEPAAPHDPLDGFSVSL